MASCICSATSTAPRCRRRSSRGAPDPAARPASPRRKRRRPRRTLEHVAAVLALHPRQLQLRLRGDHPRAPHATEYARPSGGRDRRARGGGLGRRLEARADRPAAGDRLRLHHRDDQLGPRTGNRRGHDFVRPACEARKRRGSRCRADRDGQRGRNRLPRLRRGSLRPEHSRARPNQGRTGEPDADRTRRDDPGRDRHEGVYGPRNAPSRGPSFGARCAGLRRLDGRHLRCGRRPPVSDLLDCALDGLPRRPDTDRGRRPLGRRGRLRRDPRCARHPRLVPALLVTDDLLARATAVAERAYAPYSNYRVGAAVRARDGRIYEGVNVATAAYPLGICAERTAIACAVVDGCRPGDLVEIAITASPCGGCRQWLYEFRLERVTFPKPGGEVVSYTPGELLPETWDLPA